MLRFAWCDNAADIESLATFFSENVTPLYISHSELQSGRASEPGRWSSNFRAIVTSEIEARVPTKQESCSRVAVAYDHGNLVAISYVTFNHEVPVPYLVIEDLVVDATRQGNGAGKAFLDWIVTRGKHEGIKRAFVESGKANQNAHNFFERNGFSQVSTVMMADLTDRK